MRSRRAREYKTAWCQYVGNHGEYVCIGQLLNGSMESVAEELYEEIRIRDILRSVIKDIESERV